MATRYPLVIDTTDGNKIKELPENDNLNLATNNIVNVVNVTASGTLTTNNLIVDADNITINLRNLNEVAFSGDYTDLNNLPTLFSGDYADLTGKPDLVRVTEELGNVSSIQPQDGQILKYDQQAGLYIPSTILDINDKDLVDLRDVAYSLPVLDNMVLKYYSPGYWANGKIDFSELTGTENVFVKGEDFIIGDIRGSLFGSDSSVLVDAVKNTIPGTLTGPWYSLEQPFTVTTKMFDVVTEQSIITSTENRITLSSNDINFNTINDLNISATNFRVNDNILIAGTDPDFRDTTIYGYVLSLNAGDVVQIDAVECNFNSVINTGFPINAQNINANIVTGNFVGSVFGDDSTVLVDGISNEISAMHLSGQLPSLDASNLYNIQLSNSTYIDYGYDGLNNIRTVLDLAPIVQSDGTDLTLSITVSPSYTKVLVELNIRATNITDTSSECYIALQRSTNSGATWTTLNSCQTTAVEATATSFANILLGSFVRWIDDHGESTGTTILYRFINNTDAVISSGVNDQIRIWYQDTSCVASAKEVK